MFVTPNLKVEEDPVEDHPERSKQTHCLERQKYHAFLLGHEIFDLVLKFSILTAISIADAMSASVTGFEPAAKWV